MGYYLDPVNMEMVWDGVNEVAPEPVAPQFGYQPNYYIDPITMEPTWTGNNYTSWNNIAPTLPGELQGFNAETGDFFRGQDVANPLYSQIAALPTLTGLTPTGTIAAPTTGNPINNAMTVQAPDGTVYNAFQAGVNPFEFMLNGQGQLQSGSNQGDSTSFAPSIAGFTNIGGQDYILSNASDGLPGYNTVAPMKDSGMTDSFMEFGREFVLPALLMAAGAGAFSGTGAAAAEGVGAATAADAGSALTAAQAADMSISGVASSTPWESFTSYLQNIVDNPSTLLESAAKKAATNAAVQGFATGDINPQTALMSGIVGGGLGALGGATGAAFSELGLPASNALGNAAVGVLAGANPENIALGALTNVAGGAAANGLQELGVPSVLAGPAASGGLALLTGNDPLASSLASLGSGIFSSLGNQAIQSDTQTADVGEQVAGTSDTNMDGFMTSLPEMPKLQEPLINTPIANNYLNSGNGFSSEPQSDGSFNVGGFTSGGGDMNWFEDYLWSTTDNSGWDNIAESLPDTPDWYADYKQEPLPDWYNSWVNSLDTPPNISGVSDEPAYDTNGNAISPPAPTVSIPGFGDVYGNASSILKGISQGVIPMTALGGILSNAGGKIADSIFGKLEDAWNKADVADLAQRGLAAGTVMSALNDAKNSGNIDTSQLESSYSRFNPEALTGTYDLASGAGRAQLASNLARRGVAGSSFGNMDLANYDMTRDVGRQAILGQGISQQANIANQILQSKIAAQKNRNDLYGRSLLALGQIFQPRR